MPVYTLSEQEAATLRCLCKRHLRRSDVTPEQRIPFANALCGLLSPADSALSVHRMHSGDYFIAHGYRKADSGPAETCRVSPFYASPIRVGQAYEEKRAEYGELNAR